MVIWKPRSAEIYRVFLDQCPHRLAPLSEGRVDEQSGHLMCSYHGWQFDGEGVCQSVPQADSNFQPTHPQLCVTILPSREANDLFWIWPDPMSADLASQTPLPLSPQIDAKKGFVWDSYVRDLEYDWQTLADPGRKCCRSEPCAICPSWTTGQSSAGISDTNGNYRVHN
jgi:phenylpropionate dioxygenase-like ring-hydroxylating dioxygenase large terminal subunit